MPHYDVFNGDADGICALQQLRLNQPVDSVLITGVKRDIQLLKRIDAQAADSITVLDISLDKNRDALNELLDKKTNIEYFDHHFAGELPRHPNFTAHINTQADVCTSLLVNEHLGDKHLAWAVVGAFGDNLDKSAQTAAITLNLTEPQLQQLKQLGILINYNAYGITLEDLYFKPDDLFIKIRPYSNPLEFIQNDPTYNTLKAGYENDMDKARSIKPEILTDTHGVYIFPSQPWANRVSGVYGNDLAKSAPDRAHALLTELENKSGYRISVRAPLSNKTGADELCRKFPTGGGRKAAAGINQLPNDLYDEFINEFRNRFVLA